MKSIIPVNNRYQIELDRYSWQIAQWKTRQNHPDDGKFEGTHWFPTLEMTVKKLVELQIAEADLKGARDVIDALRASTSRLAAAIERGGRKNLYTDEHRRLGGAISGLLPDKSSEKENPGGQAGAKTKRYQHTIEGGVFNE